MRKLTYEERIERSRRAEYKRAFADLLVERGRRLEKVQQWYVEKLARLKEAYGVEDDQPAP